MTAPTEEEIRAGLARGWTAPPPNGNSVSADWSEAWTHVACLPDALYDLFEMRESEIARLDELARQAIEPIKERAGREVIEAIVGVVTTFAAEHPDTPRKPARLLSGHTG